MRADMESAPTMELLRVDWVEFVDNKKHTAVGVLFLYVDSC